MFEAFVTQKRVTRVRWLSASFAAHILLLLIAARLMINPPAAVKEAPVVTFMPAPPPPPPPPAGSSKPNTPKTKPRIRPDRVVQPTEVPKPTPPQPAEEPEQEAGQVGGVKGGVAGGVVGGVVGGKISEFDGRMTPPRLLAGPTIQYTDKALEHDVEGLMIVRCILSRLGDVKACEIKQSVRFMDNAVVETLQKRRYTPVTLEGQPIDVYYTFRVRLNLPR